MVTRPFEYVVLRSMILYYVEVHQDLGK